MEGFVKFLYIRKHIPFHTKGDKKYNICRKSSYFTYTHGHNIHKDTTFERTACIHTYTQPKRWELLSFRQTTNLNTQVGYPCRIGWKEENEGKKKVHMDRI